MKITPSEQMPARLPVKPAADQPQQETGPTFGQVLNQAVEQQPSPVRASTQPMVINRPPAIGSGTPNVHEASAAEVNAGLDALETYRCALRDSQMTLRDLAPLRASLEAIGQTLDEKLSNLPKDDPLRQIGDQTRSLIVAEQARFDSGIYN
jgi:hypothetical protein